MEIDEHGERSYIDVFLIEEDEESGDELDEIGEEPGEELEELIDKYYLSNSLAAIQTTVE